MKILLDSQIFDIQKYGGISRYFFEVFSILSDKKDVDIVLPIYKTENVVIKNSKFMIQKKTISLIFFEMLSKLGISTKTRLRNITKKQLYLNFEDKSFDVFMPTYYDTAFLEKINGMPFVLTVYDMIHEKFSEYFENDSLNVVANKKLLIEKASKIIAISESTKNDILTFYPHIPSSKIKVIYLASSIKIEKSLQMELPEKYILFVGNRENYKNFNFFVESVAKLLQEDKSLYLIAAGGGVFKQHELEFIENLGLKGKVLQVSFEEDQLGFLYNRAKCFVFPSLYEGFGIPILESMLCGCPVVLANHSSFPEVAEDAGVYFDVNSSDDLLLKIKMLIDNDDIRANYIAKGYSQAKKFSWEATANQHLEVFENLKLLSVK
ncbi:MAG: glycosyltransferase family 4 protein [Pseudarcicella sp.]|nr:glycosyltransferase family 4 protein [Pseudarcicella sp.]